MNAVKNKIVSRAVLAFMLLAATLALAAPKSPKGNPPQNVPAFPGTLVNARYVYVTSYDGDQFNINLLPEDRQAIGAVEDALQKWGKFTLVYEPHQADIVLMVMSRPSEDVLAVYDAYGWPGQSIPVAYDGAQRSAVGGDSAAHESGEGVRPGNGAEVKQFCFPARLLQLLEARAAEVSGSMNHSLHSNLLIHNSKQDEILSVHRHPKPCC